MLLWFAVTYLTFSFMSGIFHALLQRGAGTGDRRVIGAAGDVLA